MHNKHFKIKLLFAITAIALAIFKLEANDIPDFTCVDGTEGPCKHQSTSNESYATQFDNGINPLLIIKGESECLIYQTSSYPLPNSCRPEFIMHLACYIGLNTCDTNLPVIMPHDLMQSDICTTVSRVCDNDSLYVISTFSRSMGLPGNKAPVCVEFPEACLGGKEEP